MGSKKSPARLFVDCVKARRSTSFPDSDKNPPGRIFSRCHSSIARLSLSTPITPIVYGWTMRNRLHANWWGDDQGWIALCYNLP